MEVSGELYAPATLPPPQGRSPWYPLDRAVLDAVVKRKIPSSRRESMKCKMIVSKAVLTLTINLMFSLT
jgi:hypothetical protein